MMKITTSEVNHLAEKLDGLSLTPKERAMLDALLERACSPADAEVSGHGKLLEHERAFQLVGSAVPTRVIPTAKRFVGGLDMAIDEDVLQTF